MSSLAGALDDYSTSSQNPLKREDNSSSHDLQDVEMYSPTHKVKQELPVKQEQSVKQEDLKLKIQGEDAEMDDLFGHDEDVEEVQPLVTATSPSASAPDSDGLPPPERERRQALEYEEEEIPPDFAIEVKEAEVSFPNLPVPRSSDGNNWVMRLPNFVKVDSKPFHPDTYIGPEHDDEDAQQTENIREKSMTIKLKVENTVRWRWTKDESGQDRRQSNSRVIRWSDGTLSLRLGKELFDITENRDTSAGVPRQHIGPHSSQPPASQPQLDGSNNRSQGLTYLVAQHKRSQVLQSETVITGYMTLRPTGMQSQTHRMLVRAVEQKHNKVARLRMAPDPTMDPEREKMELMKQNAKKSRRKNDPDDVLGGARKRRHSRKASGRDMMWSDDEGDDAEGGYAVSDEEDDGTGVGSSGRKSKRRAADEGKGPEDYQEDDFVVPDSSDEEAGRRGARKEMMDEDPLDRIDAKIEQQDAQKRKRGPGGKGSNSRESAGAEDGRGEAMDIESEEEEEEEEEELKVRKIGGSGTRKRAAVFEDEDDE